jgi:hypothetical protein
MRLRKNLLRHLVGVIAAAYYSVSNAEYVGLVSFDKFAIGGLGTFL